MYNFHYGFMKKTFENARMCYTDTGLAQKNLYIHNTLGIISEQKKSNFCWLSIDPSLPTPFLLSKAEEEASALPLSHPLPPKAGKNCTLSGALVTMVPLNSKPYIKINHFPTLLTIDNKIVIELDINVIRLVFYYVTSALCRIHYSCPIVKMYKTIAWSYLLLL